ncbi:MAG: restriction endonuclease subunit S [Candidatus Contendobacter sp.]|nr:restriction endonuclease subunit S [Candidatus Contendobacter sp.]
MNPAQLLAHFDRISEAPDAIPRLRRFILDLAVRGKLVEQDPNDEPAGDLMKRIQVEKVRLVKAGEIRKEKPLLLLDKNEILYSMPIGWEWVRMRQVTSDHGQKIPIEDFTYIDVTAINKEVGCISDTKIISAKDAPSRARKIVKKGDVLFSCVRPYLLNIAVIDSDIVPAPIASTAFAVLNGLGLILPKYLWIVLRSPFMVECVEAKMRGQAYPAINDSDFALLPFPLPPLPEQHRIVAKVNRHVPL